MPTVFGDISYIITFEEGGTYKVDFEGNADFIINEGLEVNA
jgi:hypothetical protein